MSALSKEAESIAVCKHIEMDGVSHQICEVILVPQCPHIDVTMRKMNAQFQILVCLFWTVIGTLESFQDTLMIILVTVVIIKMCEDMRICIPECESAGPTDCLYVAMTIED